MQDATNEPAEPQGLEPIGHDEPAGMRKDAPPVAGTPSPLPPSGPRAQQHALLPQRGLYYAVITGVIAGVFAALLAILVTFLVSLIPSYPGNLAGNGAVLTPGSLVISFLLLCLWCIGGGLVSLFGTWVATVRHAYYVRYAEESLR